MGPGPGELLLVSRAGSDYGRVEFMGLPGSGKSTVFARILELGGVEDRATLLVRALRSTPSDRPIRSLVAALPRKVAERRAYELFYRSNHYARSYFRFAAEHPELLMLTTRLSVVTVDSTARAWRLIQKHSTIHATYQFEQESGLAVPHPLVLDEEFAQMLLLALAGTTETDRGSIVEEYLEHCPLPDTVVAARADAGVCADRVEARHQKNAWPVLLMSKHGREVLARMADAYDDVLSGLRARGVAVHVVDTNGSLESTREQAEDLHTRIVADR